MTSYKIINITVKLFLDSATLELEELQNKKEELDGNTEKLSKENKDLFSVYLTQMTVLIHF
jgi:hypothetical protein